MSASDTWPEKYRPRLFEDVIGQPDAVARLGVRISAGNTKGLVIAGPTGSGKSTLAMIYAQALLCERPRPSGSPCLLCSSCRSFDSGLNYSYELYLPERHYVDDVRSLVQGTLSHTPMDGGRYVVLFDESQLQERAYGILNSVIDHNIAPTTFIFTLINREKMLLALRDRLDEFELAPADPDACVGYLKRICRAEGVVAEDEALQLIADATDSFRHAVRDLEAVASIGPITVESVHQNVLGPRFAWLVAYLESLADGDLEQQLKVLSVLSATAEQQADLILGAINTAKLRVIGPTRVPRARGQVQIANEHYVRIVEKFRPIASAAGAGLPSFWNSLIDFWSALPGRVTSEVLRGRILRLHDLLHHDERPPRRIADPERESRRLVRAKTTLTPENQRKHLSLAQATDLYEAATFALQVCGTPFNVLIRIHWRQVPRRTDAELATAASDFVHSLQLKLARPSRGASAFQRILLNERDAKGRLLTTIVGHVPVKRVGSIKAWLERPDQPERWGATFEIDIEEVEVEEGKAEPDSPNLEAAIPRHWALMSQLWRGVDPTLEAIGAQTVIDALGVTPRRQRAAGAITCRRYAISKGLGPDAQRRAAAELFPHWSAVRRECWADVRIGWEAGEFEYRRAQASNLAREMARLKVRFGGSGPFEAEAFAAALENIKQNQSVNQRLRQPPWVRG